MRRKSVNNCEIECSSRSLSLFVVSRSSQMLDSSEVLDCKRSRCEVHRSSMLAACHHLIGSFSVFQASDILTSASSSVRCQSLMVPRLGVGDTVSGLRKRLLQRWMVKTLRSEAEGQVPTQLCLALCSSLVTAYHSATARSAQQEHSHVEGTVGLGITAQLHLVPSLLSASADLLGLIHMLTAYRSACVHQE
jgi:hypothetical protein